MIYKVRVRYLDLSEARVQFQDI